MGDFIDEYYEGKDLSLLKKLTLVIPTYNRNYYLSRCLWYHAHFPFGEIIVADSSPEEKKVVNRETVRKIHEVFGVNVRYLEYEPETEKYGGDIYRKWGDAVQHVETEYSQFCTDKAFKCPRSQVNAIRYLDAHEDYFSATFGTVGGIVKIDDQHKLCVRSWDSFKNVEYVDDSDGFQRFSTALQQGWTESTLLEITRTKFIQYLYNSLTKNGINDIRYGELYLGYSGYIFGRHHYDKNDISAVRDVHLVASDTSLSRANKIGSGGSSTTRYPYITSYEYTGCSEGRTYQRAYLNAIKTHLQEIDILSNKTDYFIKNEILPTIFIKYGGFPDNTAMFNLYTKLPILSMIDYVCPGWLRTSLINIIRRDSLNSEALLPITPELNIILKIVRETETSYQNDETVQWL